MSFLKRVEIWVLLALVVGGVAWVFTSKPAEELEGPVPLDVTEKATAPIVFKKAIIERDYGNVRFDLDVQVRNEDAEKLVMSPPAVRLVTAAGREIATFFLPFEKLPEVPAKSSQQVQLRYWLEKQDLQGAITLHVKEHKLEVKSASPLDIEALKNGEPRTVNAVNW